MGRANFLKSTRADAQFSFTEHSGASIGAARDALNDIKDQMEVLGLAPLTSRSGSVTATAKAIDESKASSDLEAWARVMERALWEGYWYAAEWIKTDLPEGFKVDIYSDFGLSMRSAEDAQVLLGLYQSGSITAETLLSEFKRRGVLSEMVDPAEEAQAARDASPMPILSMGDLGGDDDEDDPGEGTAVGAEGSGSGQAA